MADNSVERLREIADLVTRLRGACFNNSFYGETVVATCSEGKWGVRCPPCATADLIEDQQDEIERLRVAGDALAWQIRWIEENHPAAIRHDAPLIQWEIARRG